VKLISWVLWPAFLAAAVGVGIVFTLIDPMELVVLGGHIQASRLSVYSLGFFVLWSIAAMASGMTALLTTGSRNGKRQI
jgi:hypothetical protein